MYLEDEQPKIYKEITSNNYLSNCYNHLTRIKIIHVLFLSIELLLNIIQELETFQRDYKLENISVNNNLNLISSITIGFDKISTLVKLIIVIVYILLFDALYFFLRFKKFKIKHIRLSILANILELFIYRVFMLIFFNFFFALKKEFLIIGFIFLIPHVYLIINNFLYNHLYYFVPEFIDYPYDEFSSIFDIILLIIKLLVSISGTSNNVSLGKFSFLILICLQIFFSFYFINILRNHSYLFMRNSFLNRSKCCLFFTKTIIVSIGLLFGKNDIMNIMFLIICISILLIIISYMHLIYNPFSHVIIKRETPMENIFFYLYILSEKNDYEFLFKNKINEHFEKCGICYLCKKYLKYKDKINIIDDEKEKLIKEENNQVEDNNKNLLIEIFDIVYDNENKYFQFIKKIVIESKKKGKESFIKNNYYFINLSFLIYSDYKKNNITLSLNERLILEEINRENISFLDNHESKIAQIFLSNRFILLSNKILSFLKDTIKTEANLNRAKKLINLSALLKRLKNPKYKEYLFSHKLENISDSRHLIIICSIVYEELFNTSLNNSQFPLRDNIQPLEDIFNNNSNKINKTISLLVNLINKTCIISRAGKGMHSYINTNLFDLFPLIIKEYQINLFISNILENFENENKEKANRKKSLKTSKYSTKLLKSTFKGINYTKNKKDFIEIKLIICQNIESKTFYKLLNLKLTPLFNNNILYYILFDGFYNIHKNTIITLKDLEKNKNSKERLVAVSEPELEKNNEAYSIPFKKYFSWQNSQGFTISKISSFNISEKFYNIYSVENKDKDINKKGNEGKKSQIMIDEDEEEFESSINKKDENLQLMEENASVSSQNIASSSYNVGISNIGIRNKKNDNIYEYGGFNKVKMICILVILIAIIVLIIEYIVLTVLKTNNYDNNISLFQYNEFSKLYFQLFSSVLSLVCIGKDKECVTIVDYFINQNSKSNQNTFDYQSLVESTNLNLAHQIMEKRSYLVNIHKRIGNKEYNQLFGKIINYSRITQNIKNNKYYYNIITVSMEFSEAILIICNSFQILAKRSDDFIILLSGKNDPLDNLNNEIKENIYLNQYQKEMYELILNYKMYFKEFNKVNEELQNIIDSKTSFLKIFAYFNIIFDTSLIVCFHTLLYLYTALFEFILIKIINYVNMTMNIKNDDFNFSKTFSKKIENLEIILQFYDSDPIKAVQNLNSIYANYQQILTSKNKNKTSETNKKNYKKIIEENKKSELDNIPKDQRIISRSDVKALGITFRFVFIYYFNLIIVLASFIFLLILWTDYFTKKNQLFILNQKNINLEMTLYKAINSYHLMLFHNLTISEVAHFVISNSKIADLPNSLINNFYENLKLAFNSKKEKNNLGKLYQDFEDKAEFSCENMYILNHDSMKKLENYTKERNITNIEKSLIELCAVTNVDSSKDFRIIFVRHLQYIKSGIQSINDFSYDSIMNHIMNEISLSRVSLFFDNIIIYIVEIVFSNPFKEAIDRLTNNLQNLIVTTELLYLSLDIISFLLFAFFYISGINSLCSQIFILKNIFKIYEINE